MRNFNIALIILISATVSFFFLCDISFAATSTAISEINFKEDLGISAPFILPNSPFYFLKEWRRLAARFFAFDQIKKISLESEILNQKAAEIESMGIFSADSDTINNALLGYQKSLFRFNKILESVKITEVKENTSLFLDRLIKNLAVNMKYFDELEFQYNSQPGVAESLMLIKKDLNRSLALIFNGYDAPDNFSGRLRNFAENFPERVGLTQELRMAELITGFEEYLTPEAGVELQKLKDELLIKFQTRVQSEDLEFLKQKFIDNLPGDLDLRLKVFDELREKTADIGLKSRFNLLRQEILNSLGEKGVNEEKTKAIIVFTEKVLSELNQKIGSGEYLKSASISEAVERAEFNLEQAKIFFENGNYGGAFGQASAALAATRSAMNKLRTSLEDFESDFKILRSRFDEISQKARQKDKVKTLENLIVGLSEMVRKKSGFDKINADFEKALKLIIELEESVEQQTLK